MTKEFLFSINSWIFGGASIEDMVKEAKKLDVAGLDISGEPDAIEVKRVKTALDKYGIKATCINGNFTEEARAFCHNDQHMRKLAVEYGKRCVNMAEELGAPIVLMVPSQVNGREYYNSKEADWELSVESLRSVALYAKEKGIMIALEAVNKYEVMLVRTLKDAIKMAKDIGLPNVGVTGDTFHMNIEEEKGVHNAIRNAEEWLIHIHIADNTREVPGRGCLNWREIFIALDDIGYNGAVSFEPLPGKLTIEEIFAGGLGMEDLSAQLKFSINYLKSVIKSV
ncbi:MAG: sugar phosphate isomerase/epimerase family protein [Christensenellales bacterium]